MCKVLLVTSSVAHLLGKQFFFNMASALQLYLKHGIGISGKKKHK